MMKILSFLLLVLLFACANNGNKGEEITIGSSKALGMIRKDDTEMQLINLKKGFSTTLSFPSDIKTFVLGDVLYADAELLDQNHIILKPLKDGGFTNINVSTKLKDYVFIIKTYGYDDDITPTLRIDIGEFKGLIDDGLDFDFNMRSFWGNGDGIAPSKVWTDGLYTYLDYRTKDGTDRDIPAVAEVVDDVDTPVNSVIRDNVIVVHTLARTITVFSGGKWVCIDYKGSKYHESLRDK